MGDEHVTKAPPVLVRIGLDAVTLTPKRFSTGSLGWYYSGKLELEGTRVQLSITAVIVGSKPPTVQACEAEEPPKEKKATRPKKAPVSIGGPGSLLAPEMPQKAS